MEDNKDCNLCNQPITDTKQRELRNKNYCDNCYTNVTKDRTVFKSITEGTITIFDDEIFVESMSGLGCICGHIILPKKMEELLIKAYIDSGAVNSRYLYINGKEITDGINHNPFNVDKPLD